MGLFFGGEPISAIGEVVGKFFFCGEASQVSDNATQNLFSSHSQEVELCHIEVLYQFFCMPRLRNASYTERLQEAFGIFGTGGDCIQLGKKLHILVILFPAYHVPSMHAFYCVGSNLF